MRADLRVRARTFGPPEPHLVAAVAYQLAIGVERAGQFSNDGARRRRSVTGLNTYSMRAISRALTIASSFEWTSSFAPRLRMCVRTVV